MSIPEIYDEWTNFINDEKYSCFFKLVNTDDRFKERLECVKQYIEKNRKRPSMIDKNIEIKQLGGWLNDQRHNYLHKIGVMKNQEIYNLYSEFINNDKYNIYFMNIKEKWKYIFDKMKIYINTNNKLPSQFDKDKENKYIGCWLSKQKTCYSNRSDIMKNEDIYI